jgi:hypothetical protein
MLDVFQLQMLWQNKQSIKVESCDGTIATGVIASVNVAKLEFDVISGRKTYTFSFLEVKSLSLSNSSNF